MRYELHVFQVGGHVMRPPLLSDSPFPSFSVGQRVGWQGLAAALRIRDVSITFAGQEPSLVCITKLLAEIAPGFRASEEAEDHPVPWPLDPEDPFPPVTRARYYSAVVTASYDDGAEYRKEYLGFATYMDARDDWLTRTRDPAVSKAFVHVYAEGDDQRYIRPTLSP